MARGSIFIAGGILAVLLAAGAALFLRQYEPVARRAHHGTEGPVGFRLSMFCGEGTRLERMFDRLEERLKPIDAQKVAFADMKSATKTAAQRVKSSCPIEAPRNAPERLAMLEKRLEAGLDAVRTIRPAMDSFYATLSDEQKATINGRRWAWGRQRP